MTEECAVKNAKTRTGLSRQETLYFVPRTVSRAHDLLTSKSEHLWSFVSTGKHNMLDVKRAPLHTSTTLNRTWHKIGRVYHGRPVKNTDLPVLLPALEELAPHVIALRPVVFQEFGVWFLWPAARVCAFGGLRPWQLATVTITIRLLWSLCATTPRTTTRRAVDYLQTKIVTQIQQCEAVKKALKAVCVTGDYKDKDGDEEDMMDLAIRGNDRSLSSSWQQWLKMNRKDGGGKSIPSTAPAFQWFADTFLLLPFAWSLITRAMVCRGRSMVENPVFGDALAELDVSVCDSSVVTVEEYCRNLAMTMSHHTFQTPLFARQARPAVRVLQAVLDSPCVFGVHRVMLSQALDSLTHLQTQLGVTLGLTLLKRPKRNQAHRRGTFGQSTLTRHEQQRRHAAAANRFGPASSLLKAHAPVSPLPPAVPAVPDSIPPTGVGASFEMLRIFYLVAHDFWTMLRSVVAAPGAARQSCMAFTMDLVLYPGPKDACRPVLDSSRPAAQAFLASAVATVFFTRARALCTRLSTIAAEEFDTGHRQIGRGLDSVFAFPVLAHFSAMSDILLKCVFLLMRIVHLFDADSVHNPDFAESLQDTPTLFTYILRNCVTWQVLQGLGNGDTDTDTDTPRLYPVRCADKTTVCMPCIPTATSEADMLDLVQIDGGGGDWNAYITIPQAWQVDNTCTRVLDSTWDANLRRFVTANLPSKQDLQESAVVAFINRSLLRGSLNLPLFLARTYTFRRP